MEMSSIDKYTRLKRRIYLVIIPILFVTNLTYWLFSPFTDDFLDLALPPVCIYMAMIWLLIYLNRWMRSCEMISLVVFGIYHLFRIHSMTTELLNEGAINVYIVWSTTYFIYIFMVIERKRALVFSLFIFIITIIIGIPNLHNARVNDVLIQYYISTLIYILVLFYFQKIVATYLESDMLRKNAYNDALTEIGNRRSIDIWLANEIKRCHDSISIFSSSTSISITLKK